jgi:hypothetical protein
MLNYQGQPLTPIERGLNRAAPGFSMLLGSIQGLANKVEENKRLAEERNYQTRRDQTLFDRELEKIEFSTKAQYGIQTKLNEQKAGLDIVTARQKADIELQKKQAEIGIEGSPEALQVRQNQAFAESSGRTAGNVEDRRFQASQSQFTRDNNLQVAFQNTVTEYPSLGLLNIEIANGQYYMEGQPININTAIGTVVRNHQTADAIIKEYTQSKYDKATVDRALATAQELKDNPSAPLFDFNTFASQVQPFDRGVQQEQATNASIAGKLVAPFISSFNTTTIPSVRGIRESSSFKNELPKGKIPAFSDQEFRVNEQLATLIYQTPESEQREVLTEYIRNNFVNLHEYKTALSAYYVDEEDESGADLMGRIDMVMSNPVKAQADEPIYFNPFANNDRPYYAVGASEIAEQILQRVNNEKQKGNSYFKVDVIGTNNTSPKTTGSQLLNYNR